jgi:hypothetical protein
MAPSIKLVLDFRFGLRSWSVWHRGTLGFNCVGYLNFGSLAAELGTVVQKAFVSALLLHSTSCASVQLYHVARKILTDVVSLSNPHLETWLADASVIPHSKDRRLAPELLAALAATRTRQANDRAPQTARKVPCWTNHVM